MSKGAFVIFENVQKHKQKAIIVRTCGMPVLKGEKWAFNLWFVKNQDLKLCTTLPAVKVDAYVVDENVVGEFNYMDNDTTHLKSNFISNDELVELDMVCKNTTFQQKNKNITSRNC